MSNAGNEFEAAKSIAGILKDMENVQQQRVLRWVAESFGILLEVKNTTQDAIPSPGSAHISPSPQPKLPLGGQSTDIKSFVDSKSPKSDIQFATVATYFYRFEAPEQDRKNAITPDILQNAARLAGRSRFTNPLTTLNNAKTQGYLDAPERGNFEINSVGENLVAMTLPGSANNKPKSKPASRPKSKKTTAKISRKK